MLSPKLSGARARLGVNDSPGEVGEVAGREPLGVYIHFPWCLKKCPYCDFLSLAQPERSELPHEAYAARVLEEFNWRVEEQLDLGRYYLRSIFFGGGTPSLWRASAVERVIQGILARTEWEIYPEITVECNPTSLDLDHANRLADAGVNRLSIGVQGLNDERLKFLGRLHDAELGLNAIRAAVDSRVPRVSGDLIFGVHGQSAQEARAEVAQLAELGVEHLSAYALTIEPGTLFGARARKGRLPLQVEDVVADSFLAVEAELEARGFSHYEISNYARVKAESAHNLGYWRGDEYLGLGTGAFGTISLREELTQRLEGEARAGAASGGGRRVRYRNTPSAERYLSADLRSTRGFELGTMMSEVEWLDAETLLSERLMLGLRLVEGFDIYQSARKLNIPDAIAARWRALRRCFERGQLERLTEAGWSSEAPAGPQELRGSLRIQRDSRLAADGIISDLI